jgi:glycosyltransferase involved in cell wall biosynthesis
MAVERVLWILDFFPRPFDKTMGVWGFNTVKAIQKKGVEVVVLSPNPWIPKSLAFTSKLKGYANVPYTDKIEDITVFYPNCPHYFHRIMRKYLYQYVPFFDSALIWPWCKKTVEKILEDYPFQVVHSNFLIPSGYIGLKIKENYGIPFIFHERSEIRLNRAKKHKFYGKLYSKVVNEADGIITMNNKMAKSINQMSNDGNKVKVLRSGGDLEISTKMSQKKPEIYEDKKIILSVGNLSERKGRKYLIMAVDKLKEEIPNIKCIIIGKGPQLKNLERLIDNLSLNDYVKLYGQRPNKEVLGTMSWCDVFVLPSWDESSGTVYAEAMTFGKPIIACAGEGMSEVIQDGVQGLLVRKKDENSLARGLKKVLEDEDLAVRMGKEGRKLAQRELNYNFIAEQIIGLYEKVVS